MTSQIERECIISRYSYCNESIERNDFVLVFPTPQFNRNPQVTADSISHQWSVLRMLSGVDPTATNDDRVIIGFRHPNDEGGVDCHPGYGRHYKTPFINIPWGFLKFDEQPLEALSHELVQVFEDVSPVSPRTDQWKEGMCDFMRLFALYACKMDLIAEKKAECYRRAAYTSGACFYHDYAGRLLLCLEKSGGSISKTEDSRPTVLRFWKCNLDYLIPASKPG